MQGVASHLVHIQYVIAAATRDGVAPHYLCGVGARVGGQQRVAAHPVGGALLGVEAAGAQQAAVLAWGGACVYECVCVCMCVCACDPRAHKGCE